MKFIGWDTSSSVGAIAVFEASHGKIQLLSEWQLNVNAKQSECLLWGIDAALKAAKLVLEEMDFISVGDGPGSFTGLRIGLSTARSFSQALKKPVVLFNSLRVLLEPAITWSEIFLKNEDLLVVSAVDACKGEWYCLGGEVKNLKKEYRTSSLQSSDSYFCAGSPDQALTWLKERLRSNPKLKWIAVGNAVERYPDLWNIEIERRYVIPSGFGHSVSGRFIGEGSLDIFEKTGGMTHSEVTPAYLRVPDAQKRLESGELKSSFFQNR